PQAPRSAGPQVAQLPDGGAVGDDGAGRGGGELVGDGGAHEELTQAGRPEVGEEGLDVAVDGGRLHGGGVSPDRGGGDARAYGRGPPAELHDELVGLVLGHRHTVPLGQGPRVLRLHRQVGGADDDEVEDRNGG